MRPVGRALDRVVQGIEVYEVDRQLAPGDELIQKIVFGGARRAALFYGERDGVRSDMSEVQIGRETAGAVDFWLAVPLGIMRQLVRYEVIEQLQSFRRSAAKSSIQAGPSDPVSSSPRSGRKIRRPAAPSVRAACSIRPSLWRSERRQELLQLRLQSRPDDARGVLLFLQQLRWNDDIGIDRPQRHVEFLRCSSRQCSGSRIGFSSPITSDAFTSSQNFSSECSG